MLEYAPFGSEITIEAAGSVSTFDPHLAGLTNGTYVATWTSQEPDDSGIYAQIYAADGTPLSGRFAVNTHVRGSQTSPDVTALAGGGFVITWTDNLSIVGNPDDDSLSAVRGQIYTAEGSRVGGEFLVNTTVESDQFNPSIDALDDGGFVISWTDGSGDPDPDTLGVRAQQFSATGAKIGSEIVVPQLARGDQFANDVAGLPGGGFVAIWTDNGAKPGDTSEFGVFARLFDAAGVPTTGEFLVNTSALFDQADAQVAVLDNGGFVVTWHDESGQGGDGDPLSVKAQLFTGTGARVGSEILVNTTTAESQIAPTVTALPGGAFAISWQDFSVDDPADPFSIDSFIRVQVFDASGAKQGDELRVNTTAGFNQSEPAITTLANGDFVVAWQDPTGDEGAIYIRAQTFRLQPPDPATNDTIGGTRDDDTLNGRGGDDVLTGLAGDDTLYGGDGDDVLKGGTGDNILAGGVGIDTADYADVKGGGVTVSLLVARYGAQSTGFGNDDLTSIENLRGSRQDDILSGDNGANRIKGETGNDLLFGEGGDDILFGDGGDDVLDGGAGVDTLGGGAGRDTFVFTSLDGDLVKDWQAGEKIDLTAFFQSSVRLETRYGRTYAGFDSDNDGQFDFGFIVIQATGLTQSDFLL